MKKKDIFVEPTLNVAIFSVEDVVTTSSNTGGGVVLPEDEW